MFKKKWLIGAAALVALSALFVACGGDDDDDSSGSSNDAAAILGDVPAPDQAPPSGSKVFVGHDKDNKASVGLIVFADDTVAAYACDGNETWTWYTGEADGNDVELTGPNGAKLTAKIEGSRVTGSTTGAQAVSFTLDSARADQHAGLYRAFDDDSARVAGWVVENDGVTRGGLTTTLTTTVSRLGASFDPKRIADIESLPEFSEIKTAIPGFPVFPQNLTTFSQPGGLCARLATKLFDQSQLGTLGVVEGTPLNRARLGLMGRLGCAQTGIFVVA